MRFRTALLLLVVFPLTALPLASQTGGRAFVPADRHRVTRLRQWFSHWPEVPSVPKEMTP